MKKIRNSHKILLAFALLMIAGAMAGNTLAFLLDASENVTNTFIPGEVTTEVVETFNGTTKTDVSIKNTGNTDAYIRAAVVVTWQKEVTDEDGTTSYLVYGKKPTADDYNIVWWNGTLDGYTPNHSWIEGADGFYYHKAPVAPNGTTAALIAKCELSDGADVPDGYTLCVEIIGSGIQAKGVTDDGKAVVEEMWLKNVANVELKNGEIAVKTE